MRAGKMGPRTVRSPHGGRFCPPYAGACLERVRLCLKQCSAAYLVCSLPNQTPACRGLVTLRSAGSGQARSRLGRGWGWGSCGLFAGGATVIFTAPPPSPPLPHKGGGSRPSLPLALIPLYKNLL